MAEHQRTTSSLTDINIVRKYFIGERINQDMHSEIRRVTHKSTGLSRVLKGVWRKSLEDPSFAIRYKTEIKILSKLDHPNVVKVYETFEEEKRISTIFEICEGATLLRHLKFRGGTLPESEAAQIIGQVFSALNYCHSRNVVHRDLRIENIVFEKRSSENVKIVGWSSCTKMHGAKLRQRYGSPLYVAPEVLKQKYNEKADVWSCGVILYILLCGYPPFSGGTEDEILKAVIRSKYNMHGLEWSKISEGAKDLVRKLLQTNVSDRPSAEHALRHPWVKAHQKVAVKIDKVSKTNTLEELTSFDTINHFQLRVFGFIVRHIQDHPEVRKLGNFFNELDQDGNGTLSQEELFQGFCALMGEQRAMMLASKIFKSVDLDGSGEIDYTEFIVAAIDKTILLEHEILDIAFKMIDKDGNGRLSEDEFREIVGSDFDVGDDMWRVLIHMLQESPTSEITIAQFREFMTTVHTF